MLVSAGRVSGEAGSTEESAAGVGSPTSTLSGAICTMLTMR